MFTVDILHVGFSAATSLRIINSTGVPDDLLASTGAETVATVEGADVRLPDGMPAEVGQAADALLSAESSAKGRIVRRRLVIGRISVSAVQYTLDRSGAHKLWVYGRDNSVHAPDVPNRWLGWLSRS